MSTILSKPIKPLIPMRGSMAIASNRIVEPEPTLRSIPRSNNSESIKGPLEKLKDVGVAWPFPLKENASKAPQNASEPPPLMPFRDMNKPEPKFPPLQPISKERKTVTLSPPQQVNVPALEPISKEPIEVELASGTCVLETLVIPPLQPIPKTEVEEEKVEIPPLEVRPRDIYSYVILGGNSEEGTSVVHSIYTQEEVNKVSENSLRDKLMRLCIEEFKSMTDSTMVAMRESGDRFLETDNIPVSNNDPLMASLSVLEKDGEDEPFTCYSIRAVRFKLNSRGNSIKIHNLI